MPKPKYVPKHRSAPDKPARRHAAERQPLISGAVVRRTVVVSGVAVAATGVAVTTGVLVEGGPVDGAAVALSASGATQPMTAAELAAREQQSSRSSDDRRPVATTKIKEVALSSNTGRAFSGSEDLSDADPKTLAKALMPQYGLLSSQFGCLDNIWEQESHWNVHADNPHSSAYGIPQALPGSKMSSAGPDWHDSAETQIRWGLGYIKSRYGSACSAWAFKSAHGWY